LNTRSDSAEFIRTLVLGQHEANDRYEQKLDDQGWIGFPRFLATAFFLAVGRRFPAGGNHGEIVRFVAGLRATSPDTALILDAQATELVIRAALEPDVTFDLDQTTIGKIQTMVLHRVLSDENLSLAELDAFLDEAEGLAAT
jgi:hypothetical protein